MNDWGVGGNGYKRADRQAGDRAMVVAAADEGFAAVAVVNGGGVGSNKFIYLSQSQKKANELTV